MNHVVVDLDGTLCDIRHREKFAKARQWHIFHRLLLEDPINDDVAQVVIALSDAGFQITALTGRPEFHRPDTCRWLNTNGIGSCFDQIIMRPHTDLRGDAELKPALLADAFGSMETARKSVAFILEDRDKVVEAWRSLGFNCWQVRKGTY